MVGLFGRLPHLQASCAFSCSSFVLGSRLIVGRCSGLIGCFYLSENDALDKNIFHFNRPFNSS